MSGQKTEGRRDKTEQRRERDMTGTKKYTEGNQTEGKREKREIKRI